MKDVLPRLHIGEPECSGNVCGSRIADFTTPAGAAKRDVRFLQRLPGCAQYRTGDGRLLLLRRLCSRIYNEQDGKES